MYVTASVLMFTEGMTQLGKQWRWGGGGRGLLEESGEKVGGGIEPGDLIRQPGKERVGGEVRVHFLPSPPLFSYLPTRILHSIFFDSSSSSRLASLCSSLYRFYARLLIVRLLNPEGSCCSLCIHLQVCMYTPVYIVLS